MSKIRKSHLSDIINYRFFFFFLRILSVFPCFSWPWYFWRELIRYFVGYPSVCLMFFSWLDLGYGLWERRPQRCLFTSFSSVQLLSHVQLCNTMNCSMPGFPVHTPTSGACSNSCPLSRQCHLTISSSVVPFFSHLQPFQASVSFPMSQFFASGSQSVGASASILPMSIQDWFPLKLIGLISLLSKGLSRVFSNTTVQKHQFTSLCFPMKYTLSRWHSW